MLGAGGKYTELIREYSLVIAPLDIDAAKDLVSGAKISPLLSGYRGGQRVRTDELVRIVSRFSKIFVDNPSIDQIEVNPLIASADGVTAVDVRAIAGPH